MPPQTIREYQQQQGNVDRARRQMKGLHARGPCSWFGGLAPEDLVVPLFRVTQHCCYVQHLGCSLFRFCLG